MKRVIKMSTAWIAAFFMGIALTGCGGGSSGGSGTESTPQGSSQSSQPSQQELQRSAALSWNAPSTRANGDALSPYDLERYVIRYGTDRENLDKKVEIENVGGLSTMTYEIENLAGGNWYFSIQVEDVDGLVSAPSEVVSKTI